MPEDDVENKPLFEEEDPTSDLVLSVEEEPVEAAPVEEVAVVAPRWWQDRHYLESLLQKWQVPLIFLFTTGLLSLLWSVVNRESHTITLNPEIEDRNQRSLFQSESFSYFNQARREVAETEQGVQNLPDTLGEASSRRLVALLDKYDAAAFQGDDVFVLNRAGDVYARSIIARHAKRARDVGTDELRIADRWLRSNQAGPGTRRSDIEILDDLIAVNEELGDRTGDSAHYRHALEYLDRLDFLDSSRPRHQRRATLHFKSGTQGDMRLAREFVEASLLSTHPEEVANRHPVRTMLGKIYAHDGQVVEAELEFKKLLESSTLDSEIADTSQNLGEMRMILADRTRRDGGDAISVFSAAAQAFQSAYDIYDKEAGISKDALRQREIASFHLGSIKLFQGVLDRESVSGDLSLQEARDLFNRMRRFLDDDDQTLRFAINVRRAQANTALGHGEEAEEIIAGIVREQQQMFADRSGLVRPEEVVNVIKELAEVHERGRKFRDQVSVLSHLNQFLPLDDKPGRTRNAIDIARAWIRDAEIQLGGEARISRRRAAGTYLDLLDEPQLRFPKSEHLDLLWSSYLQYRECFAAENLALWKVVLDRKDKADAIAVLDRVIDTDASPRTNNLVNQALYLKGLLQEDLFRLAEAIRTHEKNIDTMQIGGDNLYVYLSYLQRARARSALGGVDNIAHAIADCDELFAHPQIAPEASPWRDARFLHGSLNLQLAMRQPEGAPQRLEYLSLGIRSLDEAVERYPDSPLLLQARVDAGLAKTLMSKLEPLNNVRYVESAIEDFSAAEKLAQSRNLGERDRDLKKIAMMNLGLAQLELEGRHLIEAARTFERLSRAFRRDRVEPWAFIQLHRTYRLLATIDRNTARQNPTPELTRRILEYEAESDRAAEKAISSWDQLIKLKTQTFGRDFPLEFWRDSDKWLLDLEATIDNLKART